MFDFFEMWNVVVGVIARRFVEYGFVLLVGEPDMQKRTRSALTALGSMKREKDHAYLEFVRKTCTNRDAKHMVCKICHARFISNFNEPLILLDSGSTLDLIIYESYRINRRIKIVSNNILAQLGVVGNPDLVDFYMLPGKTSSLHAANYDPGLLDFANNPKSQLLSEYDLYLIAATAITFENGIMVGEFDNDNGAFKKAVVDAFKMRSDDSLLVVCVDSQKFVEPVSRHKSVMSTVEWVDLCSKHSKRIKIVTYIKPETKKDDLDKMTLQISKFENAGIEVFRDLV